MTSTPAPTDLVSVRQPGTHNGYGRMSYGTFQALYSDVLELVPQDEMEEQQDTIPAATPDVSGADAPDATPDEPVTDVPDTAPDEPVDPAPDTARTWANSRSSSGGQE